MIIIQILNFLVTSIIAIVALSIAVQQYKTNKRYFETQNLLTLRKINLELYQKRFTIFDETKNLLYNIRGKAGVEIKIIEDYSMKIKESYFLFDSDIVEYLHEIASRNIELYSLQKELDNPKIEHDSKLYTDLNSRKWELATWFSDNYLGLENKFMKYLDYRTL